MTKIVTIIIIVSTVWSVISGIIEKQKRAKLSSKREVGLQTGQKPTLPKQPTVEMFESRIDALRKRPSPRIAAPPTVVVEKLPKKKVRKKRIEHIKPLHQEDCPLPPKQSSRPSRSRARAVSMLLKTPQSVRTAVILSEALGKPISQR